MMSDGTQNVDTRGALVSELHDEPQLLFCQMSC